MQLPSEAVWESRRLIIEIDEDQHRKPVLIFGTPERMTASGIARDEQRALYAERKRSAARTEGYLVPEIPWERRRGRRAATALPISRCYADYSKPPAFSRS